MLYSEKKGLLRNSQLFVNFAPLLLFTSSPTIDYHAPPPQYPAVSRRPTCWPPAVRKPKPGPDVQHCRVVVAAPQGAMRTPAAASAGCRVSVDEQRRKGGGRVQSGVMCVRISPARNLKILFIWGGSRSRTTHDRESPTLEEGA